jgi:NitT/TauT family transport system substrate-binding protein
LLSAGHQVDVIYVADYANLVSNGLITNDRMVRENPERVQAMVRAALRGLAYTIEHLDEAFEISKAYVPELTGDAEAQDMNRAVLAASIDAWRADPEALGLSYAEEWQLSQRIMAEMDLVSGDADVTTMFSNRFVEEAGDR